MVWQTKFACISHALCCELVVAVTCILSCWTCAGVCQFHGCFNLPYENYFKKLLAVWVLLTSRHKSGDSTQFFSGWWEGSSVGFWRWSGMHWRLGAEFFSCHLVFSIWLKTEFFTANAVLLVTLSGDMFDWVCGCVCVCSTCMWMHFWFHPWGSWTNRSIIDDAINNVISDWIKCQKPRLYLNPCCYETVQQMAWKYRSRFASLPSVIFHLKSNT